MLNWHKVGASNYNAMRYALIEKLEGVVKTPYLDAASPPVATIGIGYNLEVHLHKVLTAIVGKAHWSQALENRLEAVIDDSYGANDTALLQSRLNTVMRQWHNNQDSDVPTTFAFASSTQIKQVLNQISGDYEDVVTAKLGNLPDSKERAALFSLAYNAPSLIGPKLTAAIEDGDRAEAWYEIRYNSNGSHSLGIANRRYVEANRFDLFDDTSDVGRREAVSVGRMYTEHRDAILAYESSYDPVKAGTTKAEKGIGTIFKEYRPAIDALKDAYDIDHAFRLEELQVASRANRSLTGDGTPYDSSASDQDLLLGSAQANRLEGGKGGDALIGLAGNDILFGGKGADWLDGGKGNDTLKGGFGNDSYHVGIGTDRIVEKPDGGSHDTVYLDGATRIDAANIEHLVIEKALGATARVEANDIVSVELSNGDDVLQFILNAVKSSADEVTVTTGRGHDTFAITGAARWRDWSNNGDPAKTFTFTDLSGNDHINVRAFNVKDVITGREVTKLSSGHVLMEPGSKVIFTDSNGDRHNIANAGSDWVIASIDDPNGNTFGPAFHGNIDSDTFLI